jgi:hypothetical protein
MSLLRGLATIVVRHALMLSIAVAAIYPVYYMIATSLKTRSAWTADQFGLPLNPTLDNYGAVFADGRIPVWFLNSLLVTGLSVILATVVATFAAYAIARIAFPGATFLLRMMVALMVIPPAVLILPLFLGFQPLGLVNTYQGVILIYAGMLVPISVFMLVSFFRTLPVELFEAARIDAPGPGQHRRPALGTRLRHPHRRQLPVGLERAAHRPRVPPGRRSTDAHGRADAVQGPLLGERAAGHGRDVHRRAADAPPVPGRPALLRPRPRRGGREVNGRLGGRDDRNMKGTR